MKDNDAKRTTFTFQLPPEMVIELEHAAADDMVSTSAIIRQAVKRELRTRARAGQHAAA